MPDFEHNAISPGFSPSNVFGSPRPSSVTNQVHEQHIRLPPLHSNQSGIAAKRKDRLRSVKKQLLPGDDEDDVNEHMTKSSEEMSNLDVLANSVIASAEKERHPSSASSSNAVAMPPPSRPRTGSSDHEISRIEAGFDQSPESMILLDSMGSADLGTFSVLKELNYMRCTNSAGGNMNATPSSLDKTLHMMSPIQPVFDHANEESITPFLNYMGLDMNTHPSSSSSSSSSSKQCDTSVEDDYSYTKDILSKRKHRMLSPYGEDEMMNNTQHNMSMLTDMQSPARGGRLSIRSVLYIYILT
jgi:hypothetical protein